ncbi:AlpA family transcriptional regulator [Pseudomonas sp. URMO17WK12:I6]|uniref:helix-turn-helix transcriptional regulator n=1 Tax=Pseudomonas sp. URMO17WK12:I6 TaxID=1261629 RepID=UPI000DADAD85|nr:AlpA family phage regulatory protein [Pseudomonas sp. URMO17WK12:I6]PZW58798.1 AlpA family transcriptional regulator [Pseudomonas sp. URMO17WK12:I6]
MKASIIELPRLISASSSPLFDASSTLIRMPEVEGIVGMKRSTIYKLMQRPDCCFPQPVKLSNSTARGAPVAWVLSEVQAWARSRIEARDQVAA